MIKESLRLEKHIKEIVGSYKSLDEDFASIRLSDEKWSIKEIFGHLIDSASNNYQRFIRLQERDELEFPGYDFDWIKIIKYNSYPYTQIIGLWEQYNLLLCHIIRNISENDLSNVWVVEEKRLTLRFLIVDYIDHMEIHLKQLEERLEEKKTTQLHTK